MIYLGRISDEVVFDGPSFVLLATKSIAVGLLSREFSGPNMGMEHGRHRGSIEIALHDFLYCVLHSVTFF